MKETLTFATRTKKGVAERRKKRGRREEREGEK
jgi:hypothetical protein